MRLLDRVAQCRMALLAEGSNLRTRLTGAAEHAGRLSECAFRYVLSDELTRLCAALAYSKGARALQCVDLIRMPAERVWVEWSREPWFEELRGFGFRCQEDGASNGRCRGALIEASRDGRRGSICTFWDTNDSQLNAYASPMRAQFDLDGIDETTIPDRNSNAQLTPLGALQVLSTNPSEPDLIAQCFRFKFEQTWATYYRRAQLSREQSHAVQRQCLGTIAPDIPLLLAFFLLLATRTGLPQQCVERARLNRIRGRDGRPCLLDHIEVRAPLLPYSSSTGRSGETGHVGRARRLHAVRGHLVRRGSQVFWRVPHLRGSARWGTVRSRTVSWRFDEPPTPFPTAVSALEAFAV